MGGTLLAGVGSGLYTRWPVRYMARYIVMYIARGRGVVA